MLAVETANAAANFLQNILYHFISKDDWNGIVAIFPFMMQGAWATLYLTIISVSCGVVLGLFLALARLSRIPVIDRLAQFYIWFFRGSPLLMQLLFIYYMLPLMIHVSIPPLAAALVALGLNSAAYLAEIIRAAIQSIDKGQMEAARALGMTYWQAMRRVVVPQSYRRLIPPVGNEFIALLKDTSLVSIVTMTDLMYVVEHQANSMASAIYYLPGFILYLLLTTLFTFVFGKLEKKFSIYE